MSRKIVLVTGGAGFIGSNIVAEMTAADVYDVAVCDRLRAADLGKWRNLAKHPIYDLVSPEELWTWLQEHAGQVALVIHMGAISSTQEPDADKILRTNFALSRDLYRWCADHDSRLIYASSAATYGDGALGFDDRSDFAGLKALRPLNAYGWSKALFDLWVARETEREVAPRQCVGLKFFNVYGPNETHKGRMRSIVAQIWPEVAAGKRVKLFKSYRRGIADGGQLRDFVDVGDAARIVAWVGENPTVNGLFNVGSGKARSFADLAAAVFSAAGRAAEIDYVEMPEDMRDSYQYLTEAPMHRLHAAGYRGAATDLEAGVARYVRDYLSQSDSYR